jgi:DNA-damage-inducible protein D
MHEITDKSKSPFDSIRQRDERGSEFWYARQLMPVLGYKRWLRFVETIDRAKVSCFNCDIPVELNFADVGQMTQIGGSVAEREVTTDYGGKAEFGEYRRNIR